MKDGERNIIIYLEDIIDSANKISEYTKILTYEDFIIDNKTIDAVIRNFEIIGEATKNLPNDFKNKYTMIPWEEMYRFRNIILHEYFGIDYSIVWKIVTEELPKNLIDLLKIKNTESGSTI